VFFCIPVLQNSYLTVQAYKTKRTGAEYAQNGVPVNEEGEMAPAPPKKAVTVQFHAALALCGAPAGCPHCQVGSPLLCRSAILPTHLHCVCIHVFLSVNHLVSLAGRCGCEREDQDHAQQNLSPRDSTVIGHFLPPSSATSTQSLMWVMEAAQTQT